MKRLFDIIVALLALSILALPMLAVSIMVKLTSRDAGWMPGGCRVGPGQLTDIIEW